MSVDQCACPKFGPGPGIPDPYPYVNTPIVNGDNGLVFSTVPAVHLAVSGAEPKGGI